MRRISGIWPPSKPMRMELPERAVWPLPPRPLVLPWPLDSPWPRRLRRCRAPGRGFKSCKRIAKSGRQAGDSRGGRRDGLRGGHRLLRFLYGKTAALVNIFAQTQLLEPGEGGFDHVGRVLRAERLA